VQLNNPCNVKIVTEKDNLAWLAELAISKARIDKEEIDYVRYSAGMLLLLPAAEGVVLSLTPRQQLIYTSAVFSDCTVLRDLFTTALGLLKPNIIVWTLMCRMGRNHTVFWKVVMIRVVKELHCWMIWIIIILFHFFGNPYNWTLPFWVTIFTSRAPYLRCGYW
jgi:hypothetical protein